MKRVDRDWNGLIIIVALAWILVMVGTLVLDAGDARPEPIMDVERRP